MYMPQYQDPQHTWIEWMTHVSDAALKPHAEEAASMLVQTVRHIMITKMRRVKVLYRSWLFPSMEVLLQERYRIGLILLLEHQQLKRAVMV